PRHFAPPPHQRHQGIGGKRGRALRAGRGRRACRGEGRAARGHCCRLLPRGRPRAHQPGPHPVGEPPERQLPPLLPRQPPPPPRPPPPPPAPLPTPPPAPACAHNRAATFTASPR